MNRKDKILNSLMQQEKEEGLTKNIKNIRKLLRLTTNGDLFNALVRTEFKGSYPNAKRRYYMQGTFESLIEADWEV